MYGKIFEQIYDSSVCQDWKALIVFQQMIILSDLEGVIDKTPESISRRTNIPLDIIQYGIKILEKPDPESRCPDEEGRRIIRLDEHRTWGWRIVNKQYYRDLGSETDKREKAKLRQKKFRSRNATVTLRNAHVTSCNAGNAIHIQDTNENISILKKQKTSRKKSLTTYPDDFSLTADMIEKATTLGVRDAKLVFDAFRDHHVSKSSTFADWKAAWGTWCRNSVKFDKNKETQSPTGSHLWNKML